MHTHADTKASEKISTIIQKKSFCSDVAKLSPVYQTATCEAFHSVVINFAPKFTAFCYNGMLSRYSQAFLLCGNTTDLVSSTDCTCQHCTTMKIVNESKQKPKRV